MTNHLLHRFQTTRKTLTLTFLFLMFFLSLVNTAFAQTSKKEISYDECTVNGRLNFIDGAGGCLLNFRNLYNLSQSALPNVDFKFAVSADPRHCPFASGMSYRPNHDYLSRCTGELGNSVNAGCKCESIDSIAARMTKYEFEEFDHLLGLRKEVGWKKNGVLITIAPEIPQASTLSDSSAGRVIENRQGGADQERKLVEAQSPATKSAAERNQGPTSENLKPAVTNVTNATPGSVIPVCPDVEPYKSCIQYAKDGVQYGIYGEEGIVIRVKTITNEWTYEGEVAKDKSMTGQGTLIERNGNSYKGGFKGGKWHGPGIMHSKKEDISIKGTWSNGKGTGKGEIIKKDGSVVEIVFDESGKLEILQPQTTQQVSSSDDPSKLIADIERFCREKGSGFLRNLTRNVHDDHAEQFVKFMLDELKRGNYKEVSRLAEQVRAQKSPDSTECANKVTEMLPVIQQARKDRIDQYRLETCDNLKNTPRIEEYARLVMQVNDKKIVQVLPLLQAQMLSDWVSIKSPAAKTLAEVRGLLEMSEQDRKFAIFAWNTLITCRKQFQQENSPILALLKMPDNGGYYDEKFNHMRRPAQGKGRYEDMRGQSNDNKLRKEGYVPKGLGIKTTADTTLVILLASMSAEGREVLSQTFQSSFDLVAKLSEEHDVTTAAAAAAQKEEADRKANKEAQLLAAEKRNRALFAEEVAKAESVYKPEYKRLDLLCRGVSSSDSLNTFKTPTANSACEDQKKIGRKLELAGFCNSKNEGWYKCKSYENVRAHTIGTEIGQGVSEALIDNFRRYIK